MQSLIYFMTNERRKAYNDKQTWYETMNNIGKELDKDPKLNETIMAKTKAIDFTKESDEEQFKDTVKSVFNAAKQVAKQMQKKGEVVVKA